MRIIGGKYKGRRFSPPATFKARPTTDYARESLFNILSGRYDFEGLDILDLFSGTGSIGFEFLSRGARSVQMIDIERNHVNFIRQCITKLDAQDTFVMHANAKDFLKRSKRSYDIVFADPPYGLVWLDKIPDLVFGSSVLKEGALFILEHPKQYRFNDHKHFYEHRNYGSVNFSFFSNQGI